MYLRVEHKKKNFKKTWKLESGHKSFSLGHSKQADLRLDSTYAGITGVIQFNDGAWSFTHLNERPDNNSNNDRFIPIEGPTVVPLQEGGELHLFPYDKQIQLFSKMNPEQKAHLHTPKIWLIWRRNNRIWYSEFVNQEQSLKWPHNKKPLALKPTEDWQDINNDGITLSYKLTGTPETSSFKTGAFKVLFDRSTRPYLIGSLIACLLTGLLPILSSRNNELPKEAVPPSNSTVIYLEQKKPQPPTSPKNAVAKALAQTTVPKSNSSPKPSSKKALGQVFSQIGKHSLKSIAVGNGPKTISITATTQPTPTTSATTFKALGSLGTGSGLHPSQFAKGNAKDGGVGAANGTSIGGSNLGQISQGNVGQGDLGLLHKESEVSGGLDREVIAKYIQSQKGKILFCYERQLSANPGLFGKVSVKFQIAAGGEVETYNITESTLINESVESCLLQLIAKWQFPKPKGGVKVLVSYPFVFKSLN